MNAEGMFEQLASTKLVEEIHRYLETVDLFRAEGREPNWRQELDSTDPERARPKAAGLSFEVGPH